MTSFAAIRAAGAMLVLAVASAYAQAPRPPAPPPTEADIARAAAPPAEARKPDFYLKPETQKAARESEAKITAIRKKMDERVRRVTDSVCAGCAVAAEGRRQVALQRGRVSPPRGGAARPAPRRGATEDPERAPIEE